MRFLGFPAFVAGTMLMKVLKKRTTKTTAAVRSGAVNNHVWKHFLHVLFFLVLSLFGQPLLAQEQPYFASESDVFILQIADLLRDTPNKTYEKKADDLLPGLIDRWNAGRFGKEEKDLIKQISESMRQKKLRNFPYFYDFFRNIDLLAKSAQKPESVINWLLVTQHSLETASSRDFTDHLGYSQELLEYGILSQRGSTVWRIKNASFQFVNDTAIELLVDKAGIVCASRKDSSVIQETSGKYNQLTNTWKGKNGRIDWWRFQLDDKRVFAELSDYTIDLSQSEYNADSVTFYNKDYFSFPMKGSFQDKVLNSPPNSRTSYPRFTSYFKNYEIKNIFQDIDYVGGLAMEGETVIGTGEGANKAVLFFNRNGKRFGQIASLSFIINEQRLLADRATASFYLEGDSLYHPGLQLRYDNDKRQLTLFRSESGLADSPFFDSYHSIDIYLEALYWNLDNARVYFKALEGLGSESKGYLESANFFAEEDFYRLRGIDDVNPMFLVENFLKTFGCRIIKLNAFSSFINKPPEQVVGQFLRMAAKGFLVYDPDKQEASVKDRFFNTLDARAERSDHDVIRIQTVTAARQPNITLNLDSLDMRINGVRQVILSDSQRVQIVPRNQQIEMKRNRNFNFSGLVGAGLFEFYTQQGTFDYDAFSLQLSVIDSLSFFVEQKDSIRQKQPNAGKRFIRVKNVIADMAGVIYIDKSDNKSGHKSYPQYPIFDSKSESYVYFDKPETNDGRLLRDKFFYVVDPFQLDSLDNFSTENLRFAGYLNAAGIFPTIVEPLIVMPDYSLGFDHQFDESGYAMFGEKAKFYQGIHLSNQGFFGDGRLAYLSSNTVADTFWFYPDSVRALAMRFDMEPVKSPVAFPMAQADSINFAWDADTNIVRLQTLQSPIILFNNSVFRGLAELSPAGLDAAGTLTFGQAEMLSDYFSFAEQSFAADTAEFSLYTAIGRKKAFMADRYKAKIDFVKRTGNFRYVNENSNLKFPFNQYMSTLDEANWLMDEDVLHLNNNRIERLYGLDSLNFEQLIKVDLSGSLFVSTHPEQDSLAFFCLEADYDLKEYAIKARDVKIIRVADAAVFPDDGRVTIFEDARMETLKSATIIANTETLYHRFTEAEVNIFSRHQYMASGDYAYVDINGQSQNFLMSSVGPNQQGITTATGIIEKSQDFYLNPYFRFTGNVNLLANRKNLEFSGGFQPVYSCRDTDDAWVAFDTVVDPRNVVLPVPLNAKDMAGNMLQTGYYYSSLENRYFATMLTYPRAETDQTVVKQSGVVWFDKTTGSFKLVPQDNLAARPLLQLSTNRCIVEGKDQLNLGLKLPLFDLDIYGNFEHHLIPDSTSLQTTVLLNFFFDDKLLEIMADSLNAIAKKGASLNQSNYLYALGKLSNKDESDKITTELQLYGTPRRVPEAMQKSIVLSDVKLRWIKSMSSFVSEGLISLSNVGKTQVNKQINGYLSIEHSRASDGVALYLQPNEKQWYFFYYENGIMQAISSSDDFNSRLMEIKQEKRIQTDPDTGIQYEFVISTRRKAVDFIRRMQEASYNN